MPGQTVEAAARAVGRYQLDTGVGRLTPAERTARGKQARSAVPRDAPAVFDPPSGRPDPIGLLEEQARSRVPELVPIRWGRMMVSPFTYYRGAALPMASDLAFTPVSGLAVQACGDAHLSNFGLFGSAERRLMFDVNDFDETLPGPWEWDVKRLAASLEIAGRDNGFPAKQRRDAVLAETGQTWWQILPLGPVGYGGSPYQSPSSFAGNPLLISLDRLADRGWLDAGELAAVPDLSADRVDFEAVAALKTD